MTRQLLSRAISAAGNSSCAFSVRYLAIETPAGRSTPAVRRLISFLVCDIPSGRAVLAD